MRQKPFTLETSPVLVCVCNMACQQATLTGGVWPVAKTNSPEFLSFVLKINGYEMCRQTLYIVCVCVCQHCTLHKRDLELIDEQKEEVNRKAITTDTGLPLSYFSAANLWALKELKELKEPGKVESVQSLAFDIQLEMCFLWLIKKTINIISWY